MSTLSKKTLALGGITLAIIIVAAIIYATVLAPKPVEAPVAEAAPAATNGQSEVEVTDYDPATAEQWVKDALVERTMGSESAPITMIDYSSLTCPHCAHFHLETLPAFKKEYIDTGKVKLVFSDFPLNLPALQASALSRCVKDKDAYFAMVEELFRTQEQWGATANASSSLINSVKFSGMSREEAAKCIDNQQLVSGLLEQMDKGKTEYSVNSTPTFVLIKGDTVEKVQGAQPIEAFKEAIDKLK